MAKATKKNAPWYNSDLHQCTCETGFAGSISFDSPNDVWLGKCSEARCPTNAVCSTSGATCYKGFTGTVTWTGTTFANNEWVSTCKAVNCPEHAVNHPNCECKPGYAGGIISWDNTDWTSGCTAVPCPDHSDRLESGHCSCDVGYTGKIDWNATGNAFIGECKVADCVEFASGAPECECVRGTKPSADFAFSKVSGSWKGTCNLVDCPLNAKRVGNTNCECPIGFTGTVTWNPDDGSFVGECKEVTCENGMSPPLCNCPKGFSGVPVWDGTAFRNVSCEPVPCPEGTDQVNLTLGYTCQCKALTVGSFAFSGTQWVGECTIVTPPTKSTKDPLDPLKRVCDAGFKGHPQWNSKTSKFDGTCETITCPDPSEGLGGPAGCECPEGMTGTCQLNQANQEFNCNCAALDCPENSAKFAGNRLCTCLKGYFGKLTWIERTDSYSGTCTKRLCSDAVPNSDGFPNCACNLGYVGKIAWDDKQQTFVGKCDFIACPAFTSNHPICTVDKGYRITQAVKWTGSEFAGSAELIPCVSHASGAPRCSCDVGYVSNGMGLDNDKYSGTCDLVPCPAGHEGTGHPNCACAKGYSGSVSWTGTAWNSTCQRVACPAHATGDQVCKCDDGYSGIPTWDSKAQVWAHKCDMIFCPPFSDGHPACQCQSGYTGSIQWASKTFEYVGDCSLVPCPKGSRRRGGIDDATFSGKFLFTNQVTETGVYRFKTINGDFNAYVEVSGGQKWVKVAQWNSSYTPNTDRFGLVATSQMETGKLSDEQINGLSNLSTRKRLYRIDWDTSQKVAKNYLFVETTRPHSDGSPSFGIIGDGTRAVMSIQTPTDSSSWSAYTTPHISAIASTPTLVGSKCDQVFMGSDPAGAVKFDCNLKEGERCFTGGIGCKDQNVTDGALLRSVQIFVLLDRNFTMLPAFDSSTLRSLTTKGLPTSSIPSCECFVGCAGGYDWVDTAYRGSCLCGDCPGQCGALQANPATLEVFYPPTKGFSGHILWDGTEWLENTEKVNCPAKSHGFPDCACDPGFRGVVDYTESYDAVAHHQTAFYNEKCLLVDCPSSDMQKKTDSSGNPMCICKPGFSGKATWNSTSQSFVGQDSCTPVPCSDQTMQRSQDLQTCTCPVNFVGTQTWNSEQQRYIGPAKCVQAVCPEGAVCTSDPTEKKCADYYTGKFHWDAANQAWVQNCARAACPQNSKLVASIPGACACQLGFAPFVKWNSDTQSFSGCSELAACPDNANLKTLTNGASGGRVCDCLPGFRHQPKWLEESSTYVHTCDPVPCPDGSALGTDKLCQCMVGFKGEVVWRTSNEAYEGACEAAPCPENQGTNCSTATTPDARTTIAQLPCQIRFFGSTSWNYTGQSWVNGCNRRKCPADGVVTNENFFCKCKWGFVGTVDWDTTSQDYVNNCKVVACPAPAIVSNGFCICPSGTRDGLVQFLDDDTFKVRCADPPPCPANSAGGVDCACDVGYRGTPSYDTKSVVQDLGDTVKIEQTTTRSGSCTKLDCPDFSVPGSHPNCRCASGFKGKVEWSPSNQTWLTTCVAVDCPANAANKPNCECQVGYLGTLAFDMTSQTWQGTCRLADCPANTNFLMKAGGPSCPCQKGFKATQKFEAGVGWTHTCTVVECPPLTEKVQSSEISFQKITGFMGCHDGDGTNLGVAGDPKTYLADLKDDCLGGDDKCIDVAKRACEAMIDQGHDCFGFAVASGKRIQMLNSRAMNPQLCDPETGLEENPSFTVYKRRASKGDCRCVSGYAGGFVFVNDAYVGQCTLDLCLENAVCDTTARCKQGYKKAGGIPLSYNFTEEKWDGACVKVACDTNDDPDSFPNCKCGTGFRGGVHAWDFTTERWTGPCTKVDCPKFTDKKFPACGCDTGYCRSDNVGGKPLGWNGTDWVQSCVSVKCPSDSHKTGVGLCQCDIGYQGVLTFDKGSCVYAVSGGTNLRACTRIPCPDHSTQTFDPTSGAPICSCNQGFVGDLIWNFETFAWGTCKAVECPANSEGHPNCICKSGFVGSLQWNGTTYLGSCQAKDTTNTWGDLKLADVTASCQLIRGATTTAGTMADGELDFDFQGSSGTINVLRCDLTLDNEFTKVQGTFELIPTSDKAVVNNLEIVNYNSTSLTPQLGYVAFGTRHTLVDAGKEMGTKEASYSTSKIFNIPETSVTQTNILRFELAQPTGVTCTISAIKLQTYNIPKDIVKCVRVTGN
eukprot:c52783_g1_i1.p1 GENE.c52783_g1_i1~~c52783_g1_i1.p1  ORF type:complete len:2553 (+),score=301.85 c52783_g1_i1:1089-7661(+)